MVTDGRCIQAAPVAWVEPDLGSAFYECLGYLATSPFPAQHRVVRKFMKLGVPLEDTITKKKIYQSWKDTILPVAQAAKSWIRRARASKEEPLTRSPPPSHNNSPSKTNNASATSHTSHASSTNYASDTTHSTPKNNTISNTISTTCANQSNQPHPYPPFCNPRPPSLF